jgi:hypothetical protein
MKNIIELQNSILDKVIADVTKHENDILEKAVRENAVPKIKGPITKGKLIWRGLKMINNNNWQRSEKWIEQRGVQITPKLVFEYDLKWAES